jgi:hypothetical protein
MQRLAAPFLFMVVLTSALAARADEKAEAKRHFDAGVSLLKAENYTGAALSFEASLEVYPTKTALFNLANCYKALARYDEALAALFRLRRDFAGKLGAEMEAETAAIEKEIRNLVGTLKVEVDRPGAAVLVDGREMGTAPLSKTLLLAPGNYEVTARLAGAEFAVEKVRMLAGKELTVRLEGKGGAASVPAVPAPAGPHPAFAEASARKPDPLPPAGEGAGTGADDGGSIPSISSIPSIDSPPESASPGLHPAWFWGTLGLTAVLGGVTIGLDAAVGKDAEDLPTDADVEQAERMQGAGIAFLALTGAAAITTAVLAFFTDWGGESPHPDAAPTPTLPREGREPETGESGSASLRSPRSPRSLLSLDSAPTFFATDTAAGLGVSGRF